MSSRRVSTCAGFLICFTHVLSFQAALLLLLQAVASGCRSVGRGIYELCCLAWTASFSFSTSLSKLPQKFTRLSFRIPGGLLSMRAYLANVSSSILPRSKISFSSPRNMAVPSLPSSPPSASTDNHVSQLLSKLKHVLTQMDLARCCTSSGSYFPSHI